MKKIFRLYTLIEVLMVCAIIAVLLGMGVATYNYASAYMARAKCEAMIKALSTALENYKIKTGYYIPANGYTGTTYSYFYVDKYTTDVDLNDFISIPDKELYDKGSFRNTGSSPAAGRWIDPFGTPFRYQCPGAKNRETFDLYSYGPDATNDSGGDDDITNWK